MSKGILAFDIDGTLTAENHIIPTQVIEMLQQKKRDGWNICLLTGRTFSFAKNTLSSFSFPFHLAIQNGADILEMPVKNRVSRAYIARDFLIAIDEITEGLQEDLFVYAGYEKGDFCYFRPHRFTINFEPYISKMQLLSEETWRPVKDWSEIQQQAFPLIKAIGTEKEMQQIVDQINSKFHAAISIIRDPLSDMFHLALITETDATKGKALLRMGELLGNEGPLIVAGDDTNDIPMLEHATVKIVMGTAPEHMHQMADIVAPSSKDLGILPALEKALQMVE